MIREFRIGQVFGKSLSILFGNFIPFLIIGIVVHLPLIAYSLYYTESIQRSADHLSPFTHVLIFVGLGLILTPIQTGAVIFGVFQQLRGQRASLKDCLSVGFSRMLPVLGVAIVSGMIALVGFMLLIVPGIIFVSMFYVSVPAAVVEQSGVSAALTRSRMLTKDNRLKIFGLILLLGIIEKSIDKALEVALLGPGGQSALTLYTAATLFVSIIIGIWQSSAACITYYHLRSMKESVDIEEVASVFD